VVSATDPHDSNLGFLDPEPLRFNSNSSSIILTRLEWTPFQTHYFSENLVAPGIIQRDLRFINRREKSIQSIKRQKYVNWDERLLLT
jgi:hypothetical protein